MKYKVILIICIASGSIFAAYLSGTDPSKYKRGSFNFDLDKKYPVEDVLDGDTFEIKTGDGLKTIRMLGIDTPETVDPRKPVQCFGKEASDMTKSLLLHHFVNLEIDKGRSSIDKFGRFLAYVYRDDGLFINEHLLKNGFAREYTYGKVYSFQKHFKVLQSEAEKRLLGLWKICN
ncbi:MAG: micrococcal nuclease [Patescibacteria group bacterium]|nr:micrococcal nuclease [Patescibacteria group bacterium]